MVKPMDEFTLDCILMEYNKARVKHKPMNSAHEGYAVILEELEEMWEEIKKDNIKNARLEAYQVAAMCLAFLLEIKAE